MASFNTQLRSDPGSPWAASACAVSPEHQLLCESASTAAARHMRPRV